MEKEQNKNISVNQMTAEQIGIKLISYLRDNRASGIIDFHLRIDSATHFYIHPYNKDGDTLDIYIEDFDKSIM